MNKRISLISALKQSLVILFQNENLGYIVRVSFAFCSVLFVGVVLTVTLQFVGLAKMGNSIGNASGIGTQLDTSRTAQPIAQEFLLITLLLNFIMILVMMLVVETVMLVTIRFYKKEALLDLKPLFRLAISKFPKFLLLGLLHTVLIGVGFGLLIIPGIILLVRLMFAPFVLLDQNAGVIESLKISFRMTKGNFFNIFFKIIGNFFLTFIAIIPLLIIGYTLGFVGVYLIYAISFLTWYIIMQNMNETPAISSSAALPQEPANAFQTSTIA